MTPPVFDDVLRVDAMPKPFEAQALIPQLPVKRFVGATLPRLAGVVERRGDARVLQKRPPLRDLSAPKPDRTF